MQRKPGYNEKALRFRSLEGETKQGMGARTICQQVFRAPLTRAGRGGAEGTPSTQPFFQLFPCPTRPQGKNFQSRESREKTWSKDFLEGHPCPASPAEQGRGPSFTSVGFLLSSHFKAFARPWEVWRGGTPLQRNAFFRLLPAWLGF